MRNRLCGAKSSEPLGCAAAPCKGAPTPNHYHCVSQHLLHLLLALTGTPPPSPANTVAVLPMVLELARLFGGFFLPPALDADWAKWLDAISYVRYCYMGVAQNELGGLELTCTQEQL